MLRWIVLIWGLLVVSTYAADPDYPYWPEYKRATDEEIVPQAWSKRWGSANLSNLNEDHDLDGLSNYGEYALGGNPTNAGDSGVLDLHFDEHQFTYVHASNSLGGDVRYCLLDRTNLVSGTVNTNGWNSQTIGPVRGDYVTVSDHYRYAESDQLFLNLQVESD